MDTSPAGSPLGGDHAGREAVRELLAKFGTLSWSARSSSISSTSSATASRAVALHEMTASRGDRQLDMASAVEFEIHQGMVTEVTVYHDDTYHFDAFWA